MTTKKGQASIEALVAIPILILLVTVGGYVCLTPLMMFFVEDHMEETLQCSTYQNPQLCHREFQTWLLQSPSARWVKNSQIYCGNEDCRLTIQWNWPKLLPQITSRSMSRRPPDGSQTASF